MLLQTSPGRVVAGFLLIALLSTFIANTAAYFVMGDAAELRRAVLPGIAMAGVGLTAAVLPVAAVIALALAVDFVAVSLAYELNRRGTALVTAMHYTLTVVVALFANYSLALYQDAPL
ncbi:hypothetical protein HUG10_12435 [Halorarum halophilum]|uniref:Uncharacterized protein n=1 Tax=Halorarum halophilum TaxID=2743090 RepID=A0A7D5KN74_9EURY|nr:hypothetical protein [Halobaculum halophilum]QLG28302.1 hypothetical protein HUG10_12435 [Halobaculum halophilum]